MANTNTDLTEEDAADLQFPKDNSTDQCCECCAGELVTPFFFCAVCKVNICTACFSNGAEFQKHENNHDYQIIRDDFPIFSDTNWTAREEQILLDSMQNYCNWNSVASYLPNRTVAEIKQHYEHFYLDRHGSDQLPMIEKTAAAMFPEVVVPYRFCLTDRDEPPRYVFNTTGYNYLAGYNPMRADFECDFDSSAEDLLSTLQPIDVDDPHYDMMTNLQCSLIRSYNRRLQERQRWKSIIRAHGLILMRKVNAWLHRYDLTVTRSVYDKLIRFMQFCKPTQFELLMEGLHRTGELKIQILRLCEFRQKGITTLADARLYLRLKPLHEKHELELQALKSQFSLRDASRSVAVEIPSNKRKSGFTPIEVVGMPGYEKLSVKERDLCRNVRLVPISYLQLKEVLIAENKSAGSIRLKTARRMLKIDVNKTRRLYDFLVEEGFITKPD